MLLPHSAAHCRHVHTSYTAVEICSISVRKNCVEVVLPGLAECRSCPNFCKKYVCVLRVRLTLYTTWWKVRHRQVRRLHRKAYAAYGCNVIGCAANKSRNVVSSHVSVSTDSEHTHTTVTSIKYSVLARVDTGREHVTLDSGRAVIRGATKDVLLSLGSRSSPSSPSPLHRHQLSP